MRSHQMSLEFSHKNNNSTFVAHYKHKKTNTLQITMILSRRSKIILCILLHAMRSDSVIGFAPSPTYPSTMVKSGMHTGHQQFSFTAMRASKQNSISTQSRKDLHYAEGSRLTLEEEKELLRQAVELRRLMAVEREMEQTSSSLSEDVPLSDLAKSSGYGDEIDTYLDAKAMGQSARETLVTRNMGLVHYCVGQILGKRKASKALNSLSRDDLVQEGAIGLARAVDKWNPAIGGRFSTYAVYWIRASVMRSIANCDDMLRVPEYMSRALTKVNKAANRLGVQEELTENMINVNTSWSEGAMAKRLAIEAGLTEKQLAEVLKVRTRRYTGGYVAFESWMQMGKDFATDVPSSEQYIGSTQDMSSSIEKDYLYETLSKFLRPREMEALSWRYGLVSETGNGSVAEPQRQRRDYLAEAEQHLFGSSSEPVKVTAPKKHITKKGRWGEAMSFNEVGNQMQVSAEYGRRLCHSALNKLKRAAAEGELEPALLC